MLIEVMREATIEHDGETVALFQRGTAAVKFGPEADEPETQTTIVVLPNGSALGGKSNYDLIMLAVEHSPTARAMWEADAA